MRCISTRPHSLIYETEKVHRGKTHQGVRTGNKGITGIKGIEGKKGIRE